MGLISEAVEAAHNHPCSECGVLRARLEHVSGQLDSTTKAWAEAADDRDKKQGRVEALERQLDATKLVVATARNEFDRHARTDPRVTCRCSFCEAYRAYLKAEGTPVCDVCCGAGRVLNDDASVWAPCPGCSKLSR